MSQHTPGPWSTKEANDGGGDVGICAPDVSNVVAECFADMRYAGECNRAESRANANLIAAAPDLLEALSQIIEQDDYASHRPAVYAKAVMAIRKARGEA